VAALLSASPPAPSSEAAPPASPLRAGGHGAPPDLRRAAALLDYVCGDYHRAVSRRGRVKSAEELAEHRGFVLRAARELELRAPEEEALRARLLAVEHRMGEHAAPTQVVPALREVRAELVDRFRLALLPQGPPDFPRARLLYAQACASCHGRAGVPPSKESLQLDTAPRAFADPAEVRELSPQRAFGAITFGAGQDSVMPSWAALDEADRWHLAYYVLTFARPPGPSAQPGLSLARSAGLPVDYAALATLTDRDLEEALTSAGLARPAVAEALSALRSAPEPSASAGLSRFWPAALGLGLCTLALGFVAAARGKRSRS
jgi:high-affinity iron transporter